jgi:hypothetical protein
VAGLGAFAQKKMLDFVCGGASATPPSAWWVGLSWGTPNFTGGSEIASSFGYTRQTATFGAAASPVGSASNIAAMTWLSFASACSILGLQVWDGSGTDASMLLCAMMQTPRTLGVADNLFIPAGGITITLA